jgi:hypothetical protein
VRVEERRKEKERDVDVFYIKGKRTMRRKLRKRRRRTCPSVVK